MSTTRSPKDHINVAISHSGSKAHYMGDTRNHVLKEPYVSVLYYTIVYYTY